LDVLRFVVEELGVDANSPDNDQLEKLISNTSITFYIFKKYIRSTVLTYAAIQNTCHIIRYLIGDMGAEMNLRNRVFLFDIFLFHSFHKKYKSGGTLLYT